MTAGSLADDWDATLRALRPRTRTRPLIAIVGINEATETTDYLMPYGILRRSDVADVVALATGPGPVTLYPALRVEAQATIDEFDRQHPDGADYVLVPAMTPDDDALALRWIRDQAGKGAMVIGICAGAMVLGNTGLLDDRRATTHWFYLRRLLRRHPSIRHVPDRRFVVDGNVATTTGITASMPMSITLIEAIAGRDRARAVAADLGVDHWSADHDTAAFRVTRGFALTVIGNRLAFWKREQLGIELRPNVDEVSLALAADAWSRTYRSRVFTFADTPDGVDSLGGIRVIPDAVATSWPAERALPAVDRRPSETLEVSLRGIATRHGRATARVVQMQLEYPVDGVA